MSVSYSKCTQLWVFVCRFLSSWKGWPKISFCCRLSKRLICDMDKIAKSWLESLRGGEQGSAFYRYGVGQIAAAFQMALLNPSSIHKRSYASLQSLRDAKLWSVQKIFHDSYCLAYLKIWRTKNLNVKIIWSCILKEACETFTVVLPDLFASSFLPDQHWTGCTVIFFEIIFTAYL